MSGIIACTCAFFGSLGFGILFNIRGKNLFFSSLGGFLAWFSFLLSALLLPNDVAQYFFAASVISIYAEFMAMLRKAPVTIFLVTSMIPLVPGGTIFYTMQQLILGNTKEAFQLGLYTFEIAGSIALGILLMAFLIRGARAILKGRKIRTKKRA